MGIVRNSRKGIRFVLVVLLWTWIVLAIPVLFSLGFNSTVTKVAYILAGASPSVIGFIYVFLSRDKEYIHSFLKRIISLKNSNAIELFVIFLLVPAVTVLSLWINFLITGVSPDWSELYGYRNNLAGLFLFAVFTFAFGPLAEEIGWRGYLLDCWGDKGILVYGAGIGFLWTLWHLPMFFISGTYQNSLLTQGNVSVLCFAVSTTALGIIIGKIVQKSESILAAVIFHFTINFTGEIIPLTLTAEVIKTSLYTVIAVAVLYCNLMKKEESHGKGSTV